MGKYFDSRRRMRDEAIQLLGGCCAYCGISDPIVLNIDHRENDGATERKVLNPSQICSRLVKGTLQKERYQLLCCNCNWRKEYLRRTGLERYRKPPAKKGNQNTGKDACVHGHVFDEANTWHRSDGTRACKACNRARQKLRLVGGTDAISERKTA